MVCSPFGLEPASYFRCGYGIDFDGRLIARSHHYHDESADYIENIHHAHKRNACRGYPGLSFAYNNLYRGRTVCNNNHDLSMAGFVDYHFVSAIKVVRSKACRQPERTNPTSAVIINKISVRNMIVYSYFRKVIIINVVASIRAPQRLMSNIRGITWLGI